MNRYALCGFNYSCDHALQGIINALNYVFLTYALYKGFEKSVIVFSQYNNKTVYEYEQQIMIQTQSHLVRPIENVNCVNKTFFYCGSYVTLKEN